jgi:cell division protein FtsB
MSSSAPASVRSRLSLPGRGLAEAAVQRARLSVVPRRRTRAPKVPFVTLVSLLMLAGVVGLLLFNTSMQQASFTTTALQERASNLAAREQALEMELDRLRDPQRLAEVAQRKFDMVPAAAPVFLYLDTGRTEGETGEPGVPLDLSPDKPERPGIYDPAPIVTTVTAETATATTNTTNPTNTTNGRDAGRGNGPGAGSAGTNEQHQSQRQQRQR